MLKWTGKELVLPAVRRWYSQSNVLKITVVNKIRHLLGIIDVSARPQPENFKPISGRSFKYVEVIVGKKPFKAEMEKLNNNLKTKYWKC